MSVIGSRFVSARLSAGSAAATCPTYEYSAAKPAASVPAPAARLAAEVQQSTHSSTETPTAPLSDGNHHLKSTI